MAKGRKGARIVTVDSTTFRVYAPPDSETDTTLVGENVGHGNRFWFYDGSMKLRVGCTLYKVHESLLNAHWPLFCENLILNDNFDYIPVLGISKEDLELLLDFIYPISCVPDPDALHSTDYWLRVLAASTSFHFDAPRRAAIATLTQELSPVTRIRLAHKHSVDQWRLPAFRELCERTEMLKLEEARELELEDVLNISHARELIAKGAGWDSGEVRALFN